MSVILRKQSSGEEGIGIADLLRRQTWVQHIFDTMQRSRNVIMHSGELPDEDVERIGSSGRCTYICLL